MNVYFIDRLKKLIHDVEEIGFETYRYEHIAKLENILFDLENNLSEQTKSLDARFVNIYRQKINKNMSENDFLLIIEIIINFLKNELAVPDIRRKKLYQNPLEPRLDRIEKTLNRLGSNPTLEKKVQKLEEDLRKVRRDSILKFDGEGKEQKDVLNKFKSADKKVFVIMPFDPIFKDVWKGGIYRACDNEGFACLRVDEISLSTLITEDIKTYLGLSDFVIVDITGNNPNVMFEFGWALAREKKLIVIRQQDDPNKVPFDVKDIRYIPYQNSWSGIEKLFRDICTFIKSTSETLKETKNKKNKGKTQ